VTKLSEIVDFVNIGVWRVQANKLSRWQFLWITQLRIFLLAIRRFIDDKCDLRASALTFYSLLSIVPVVAMAFAIAKGFNIEKLLAEQVMAKLEGHEEVAQRIIGFAEALLENTREGAIAGVGIGVLFWTIIKVLGNIETSFNDIWRVKNPRTIGRKLADYLSIVMICPVLLITASSLTVLVTTQVTGMLERLSFLGYLADVIILALKILPYGMIWLLFTFIYAFMPNTRVELKSALYAGIIAGTIYQVVQLIYIKFQIGVAQYGAVYGSFAALPLFLVWLQLSWLILLFGAELSFAHQNIAEFEFEPDSRNASSSFKRIVALLIAHLCVKKFMRADTPPTASDISRDLGIPMGMVRSMLSELTQAQLLSEVYQDRRHVGYQPGCDTDRLTVTSVLDALDQRGIDAIPIAESVNLTKIKEAIRRLHELHEQSAANLKLQDL
jgi:membrane protein